ncbi:MAG: N5-glutamine methyltransferase family protein [Acidimicrobiales bacterium]
MDAAEMPRSTSGSGHTWTVMDAEDLTQLVAARLTMAGCVAADEEATELVGAALGPAELDVLVRRREEGEPLAWITGSLRFCGHDTRVDRGVYVPRLQTEALATRAARHLPARDGARAVDLCTGTGAVAVHLMAARPRARVVAVDIDPRAVACARRNGVRAVLADLDRREPPLRDGVFDVVTAVAPYVPTGQLHLLPADVQRYEPRRSLDGGPDGLHLARRIVASAARLLRPDGWLLLEVGGNQDRGLVATLATSGFAAADVWFDEDGDLRGIAAQRAPVP